MGKENKRLFQGRQMQIPKVRGKIKGNKSENNWMQTENIGH